MPKSQKTINTINILQLNLNRSRRAFDLLINKIKESDVDIVIGQEPNKAKSKALYCDKYCDTFLYVNRKLPVIDIRKGEGFVLAKLEFCTVISCYFSPNKPIDGFIELLESIETEIRHIRTGIILGGDLNAKASVIGSETTDARGRLLEEWLLSNRLIVLNEGNDPTFVGAGGTSRIDFSAASEKISTKISNWTVLTDEENLSDHSTIYFNLDLHTANTPIYSNKRGGWCVTETRARNFLEDTQNQTNIEDMTPDKLIECITIKCNKHFKTKSEDNKRKPVYWWNENIASKREQCIQFRRILTRARKKKVVAAVSDATRNYKSAKTELNKLIIESKNKCWKNLQDELDENVWGKAYQIVSRKVKQSTGTAITRDETNRQIDKLFPEQELIKREIKELSSNSIPLFGQDELKLAIETLKPKKAPGPDMITPKIAQLYYKTNSEEMLHAFNNCLKRGIFPPIWKEAKLVLLEKPKKENETETSYRPICLISVIGKLLEKLVVQRLQVEIEDKRLIHENQFGFRKGRSTIDALKKVLDIGEMIKLKAIKNREFCAMILIDIKNAFNTAPWNKIIKAVKKGNISAYIIRIIESYLSERSILTSNGRSVNISSGVPQGSVLGPTLWNLFYDEILHMETAGGVTLVAYADDLAVVVRSDSAAELECRSEFAVSEVVEKLGHMGLCVAQSKTELVLLAGRRKILNMQINIESCIIQSKNLVKYLGIYINKDLSMTEHIKKTTEKATQMINALNKIMPKTGKTRSSRKKVIASTVISSLLYAAPVWAKAIKYKVYNEKMNSVLRKLCIGITAAYRTAPGTALGVLAGIPPADLLMEERCEIYKNGKEYRKEAHKVKIRKWQQIWDQYSGWTKIFINDVGKWSNREWGEVDYFTTQIMTGHGIFCSYLKKIKKLQDDTCWFCPHTDTAEHTMFNCIRFKNERDSMNMLCGVGVTKQNIAELLLKSMENWEAITGTMRKIMKIKEQKEKEIKRL